MEVFEVSKPQQLLINMLFGGFVFRQTLEGKHYVKVSKGQKKQVNQYLPFNLI